MSIEPSHDPIAHAHTVVDVLQTRAAIDARQTAFTFLADRSDATQSLAYEALHRRAAAIAVVLMDRARPGDRVCIACPPGLEYVTAFFGCLYAGMIAVPAYPPHARKRRERDNRFQAIIADSEAAIIVSTRPHEEDLAAALGDGLTRVSIDDVSDDWATAWQRPNIDSGTTAFLQYTSGSTSQPRGVIVSHSNVLWNERMIQQACAHDRDSVFVSWLPPFHDMGLVGTIIQPVYIGAPCVSMSPASFLSNPFRWLETISRYGGRTSGGPNFAYELCVRRITDEQRQALDLRTWSTAFTGAEPVHAETLERFATTFESCGFRREAFFPCYGLAEATLIVTGRRAAVRPVVKTLDLESLRRNEVRDCDSHATSARRFVGCGTTVEATRIVVADPATGVVCSPDRIGEVWVSSPSVAQGYWRQPDRTERVFRARLDGSDDDARYLRTGDLGFVSNDQLFLTGRLDDVMIIRGRNHHPEDIEWTVQESLPDLRPNSVAVFCIDGEVSPRLTVLLEYDGRNDDDSAALFATVRRAIAEQHELHAHAILCLAPGSIPKTSSGKVQRHRSRRLFLTDAFVPLARSISEDREVGDDDELTRCALLDVPVESRRSWLVARLCATLASVLQCATVPADAPLTALGLDSLRALEFKHRVDARLSVDLALAGLLDGACVSDIATQLLAHVEEAPATEMPLPTGNRDGEYPVSVGQHALWLLHTLAPDNPAYHLARAFTVRPPLDVPALDGALRELVRRHGALRTTFCVRAGRPVQVVDADTLPVLDRVDISNWDEDCLDQELRSAARRPFDLERGPLLRVVLLTGAGREPVLLFVIHHLIADQWSVGVLFNELGTLYDAQHGVDIRPLAAVPMHTGDYGHWQTRMLSTPRGDMLKRYWTKQLQGGPVVASLRPDQRHAAAAAGHGLVHHFQLPVGPTSRLHRVARQSSATAYTVLLAAFEILLHRYTASDDIVFGTLASGRQRAEFARTIGYLTNPVLIRSSLGRGPTTFRQIVESTKHTVAMALEHQDYPFACVVRDLQPTRAAGGSTPLIRVLFVMHAAAVGHDDDLAALAVRRGGSITLGHLGLESMPLELGAPQFDVTMRVSNHAARIDGAIEYRADLFSAAEIDRFADDFTTLVDRVTTDPTLSLDVLNIPEWSHVHSATSPAASLREP